MSKSDKEILISLKIKEIANQILELKKLGNKVDTKKTIQQLQQKMSDLIRRDS
jgi:hypothetical protein